MIESLIQLIREIYSTKENIFLHEPRFIGNEKKNVLKAIESGFVSSVGEMVNEFEKKIAEYLGAKYAIATVNGTAALHLALKSIGVNHNDEVIVQPLTFVATCNAIHYCNAAPVFVDVNKETLSLCPNSLLEFLENSCELRDDGNTWNKTTNRIVRACLPVHTFGFPADLEELKKICDKFNLKLIEDTAESLGSLYKGQHTGTVGDIAAFSFNGNKIITTGGGGMLVTNNESLALTARHLSTTAKLSHEWLTRHDQIGYNYRLPNLNAAIGLAQLELLPKFIVEKRKIAERYQDWGRDQGVRFFSERENTTANYWLNTLIANDREHRDLILRKTNDSGIMTRAAWEPMHKLPINKEFSKRELANTEWLYERIVNVPSGIV